MWSEKEANQDNFNYFHVSMMGMTDLDRDLFPVILAINRLPFSYSIPMSCSGTKFDHRGLNGCGYGRINAYTDINGLDLSQDSRQGYFCARFQATHDNFREFKEKLELSDLVFDEIPIHPGMMMIDPEGKSFKITHYYTTAQGLTNYWLDVAKTINQYLE